MATLFCTRKALVSLPACAAISFSVRVVVRCRCWMTVSQPCSHCRAAPASTRFCFSLSSLPTPQSGVWHSIKGEVWLSSSFALPVSGLRMPLCPSFHMCAGLGGCSEDSSAGEGKGVGPANTLKYKHPGRGSMGIHMVGWFLLLPERPAKALCSPRLWGSFVQQSAPPPTPVTDENNSKT